MEEATECIRGVKRVLEEVCDPQTLFTSLTKAHTEDEEQQTINLKLRYNNYENDFTKLKMAFTQIETKAKMTDFLINKSPEDWPSLDQAENKENFDEVKKELKRAKQEAEGVEERLTDLIEETQEKIEELETKRKEAEDAVSSVEQKRAKLESLREAHSKAMDGLQVDVDGMDMAEKLQTQREILKNTELALAKCDLVLSEHKGALSRLKDDFCMLEAVRRECRQLVTSLKEQRVTHEQGLTQQQQWLDESLKAVRELSGVSNIQVEGQTVTLDLVSHSLTSPVKAELKLHFDCPNDSAKGCSLLSAELSEDVLDMKDVVEEAVSTNDPARLVTEVKRRLTSHAPVLQEVEDLRHHYAIDYVHEERILRGMLGSSGQIVCTLSIEEGYPVRGGVKLTKIEGNGHHKNMEDYKPPVDNPSMSDWLKYLHSQL